MRAANRVTRLVAMSLFVASGAGVRSQPVRLATEDKRIPGAGPVAIAMDGGPLAHILQADGTVLTLDTRNGQVTVDPFRVPAGFQALDLGYAVASRGPWRCFTLLRRTSEEASFLLQVFEDGKQVWTWFPARGVYVGVAIDGNAGYAYAVNSSDNVVYRTTIGDQSAPVQSVARVADAERLGALTLDTSGQRLIAGDVSDGRIYIVPLTDTRNVRTLDIKGVDDVRALAWHAPTRRVLIADSGGETLWVVDPDGVSRPRPLKDKRFREPAGLTVAPDASVWLVDERARSAFQISRDLGAVQRTVSFIARDE
jgi:hypothetical protein